MVAKEARDAATIVLVRAPLEVLLVRRHRASGFMAGAFVFPGGKVDEADRAGEAFEVPRALEPTPGRTVDERALYRAACRETKEEAGIEVTPRELVYWAHWITPSHEPRRFDTRFFVTRVPPGQDVAVDAHEITEARWMAPREALGAHERGEIWLPPPTQRTLEELGGFGAYEEIVAAASRRVIAPVLPKLVAVEEGLAILLPWDEGYQGAEGEGLEWSQAVPGGTSRIVLRVPG